ncbi:MAG: histidinol dehydrogenase [Microbacteriaceae bacterium]|jgi:histidinol dehydrogenase|nr:histidinol dehydrogenase [Microbacteriaceae bacterium]
MLQRIDLRGTALTPKQLRARLPRATADSAAASRAAADLVAEVREHGAEALVDQARRFDHIEDPVIPVPAEQIRAAVEELEPDLREAIEVTIERVRRATAAQLHEPVVTEFAPGARIVQRWVPVDRVGLYVPGGKAVYPSSVIMNAVPAQVAGVESLAIASPGQQAFGGRVHPTILAVAGLLGVTEVYAMGGAGAIGALAYGVDEIGLDPVDVISGPGNAFVAAAKQAVHGAVGIDAVAGPTEILILADAQADPEYVAADLLGQAEHDEQAGSVLVTDSVALADAVDVALERRTARTMNRERATVALKGPQSATILVDDLDQGIAVSNAYAPEHLEVQVSEPDAAIERLHHAGAIFRGPFSPVPLGDYAAGSNHVLPTMGQARFSAALGSYTFIKPQQIVEYDRSGLEELAGHIVTFADAEQLPAHGESVMARFETESGR